MEITTVMLLSLVSGFLGWLNVQFQKGEEKIHNIDKKLGRIEGRLDRIDDKISFVISEITRSETGGQIGGKK
ncbi:MAG: hypothetical protein ACK421_08355 [Pseudanabaenaceae cyanobacterium]